MTQELFVRAEEVASELGISKPYAYKLVREMNEELKQKERTDAASSEGHERRGLRGIADEHAERTVDQDCR